MAGQIDVPVPIGTNAFARQEAPLHPRAERIFDADLADTGAALADDAMPWDIIAGAVQGLHDQPGSARKAGEEGRVAVGDDLAFRDPAKDRDDPVEAGFHRAGY